jgi:hypothetical protein
VNESFDEFIKSVIKSDNPAVKAVVDALASMLKDDSPSGYAGDEPKRTRAQWTTRGPGAVEGEYSNKTQAIMPATALESLLSNFVSEVDYLHNDISSLRSQLQTHLHASEFDDSLGCESGMPSSYVEHGSDMSPTQTKIAQILNEVVRARVRVEHLRSVLVN